MGETLDDQKSGHVIMPVVLKGLLVNIFSGGLRGNASASRKRISSKEEKSIAKGLNWYFVILAVGSDGDDDDDEASRIVERIIQRAFNEGRTTSQIYSSYSSSSARKTSMGNLDPVRRSMRREITRTGR